MSVDASAPFALNDGDYRNGQQYAYTTTLPAGAHSYDFAASDGTDMTTLKGVQGPTVSGLKISTTFLPAASAGTPYSATPAAVDGIPPYRWSSLSLPPALGFDPSQQFIQGIPSLPGTFAVTISVSDAAGVVDSRNFTLTVTPSQPPKVYPHADIVVDADGPAGRIVTFVVTAVDVVDPHPQVFCNPPSGSTFVIGETVVVCVAKNALGAKSLEESFRVFVKGVREQLDDLAAAIDGSTAGSFRSALLKSLKLAVKSLDKGAKKGDLCTSLDTSKTCRRSWA